MATVLNEDAKLVASDADAGDVFGFNVSLSGDRALVGAYRDGCAAGASCGAAYVFEYVGGAWVETAKLVASDAAAFADFGRSVSLSGDRALIAARGDVCATGRCGAAYVFAFDGSSWSEEAKLTASDASGGDDFGRFVSLSGGRALIGAIGDGCAAGARCGSAYVFAFDGSSWSEEAKLTASDADDGNLFGLAVSLSEDHALVGASADDCDAGFTCGSAYVFAFDGSSWSEEAKLTASDASGGDSFGFSVSLSGDRALVGSPGTDCAAGVGCGAAYLFEAAGGAWSETAKLVPSDGDERDAFRSVSLSGNQALVGASNADCTAGPDCGSAYWFSLGNSPPEAVAAVVDDPPVVVGQTVTLDGSQSSDPDGDPLLYEWDVAGPDGTAPALSDPAAVAPSFCAASPGDYTATLVVDDGAAADEDVAVVTAVTAEEALADAAADVEALGPGDGGPLNSGQVQALTRKLDQAARKVEQGKDPAPHLADFAEQVATYVAEGVLTEEQAGPLTESADAIDGAVSAPCSDGPPAARRAADAEASDALLGLEAAPNPSRGPVRVRFVLAEAADVRLAVLDVLGREVAVLLEGHVEAGSHAASFDGAGLPAGAYTVLLRAGPAVSSVRVTVVR